VLGERGRGGREGRAGGRERERKGRWRGEGGEERGGREGEVGACHHELPKLNHVAAGRNEQEPKLQSIPGPTPKMYLDCSVSQLSDSSPGWWHLLPEALGHRETQDRLSGVCGS